jgi:hypothetical protein
VDLLPPIFMADELPAMHLPDLRILGDLGRPALGGPLVLGRTHDLQNLGLGHTRRHAVESTAERTTFGATVE